MKRVYKKSRKLLQTSSLLALALCVPVKAAPPESLPESLTDRTARAVAIKLVKEHPIEKELSPYFDFAATKPEATVRAIVHHLPTDTRGKLLNFIGDSSDLELMPHHQLLASSIFDELQKDQTNYLELSFKNDKIEGRHKLLGHEFVNLTRIFKDETFNYFSTLALQVNVENVLNIPNILPRLSTIGISRLKLGMNEDTEDRHEVRKAKKLATFFQSGWNKLEALDLSFNNIGAAGVTALANSQTLIDLQSLDLTFNNIRANGVRALANSPNLAKLQSLNLGYNNIRADEVTELANSQFLTDLQRLDLSSNNIGDDGATALANSPNFAKLQSLILSYNNIRDDGATALANSPNFAKLQSLYLSNNNIGNAGATALANSQFLTDLKTLALALNDIGYVNLAAIKQNPIFRNTKIEFWTRL